MMDLSALNAYCAKIGADRLIVQAAGGNISLKSEDTLWIKASGCWMEDAQKKDIFVPVDLLSLRSNLAHENFDFVPKVVVETRLRPSIETLFHALIPSRVVLHTHSIEVLAVLVREDAQTELEEKIGNMCEWIFVDYHKPGPNLAEAIHTAMQEKPLARIVFMRNHGIIIGADSVEEVDRLLRHILNRLSNTVYYDSITPNVRHDIPGYQLVTDNGVHVLALDTRLHKRLARDWVLYPDHVIFLDPVAYCSQIYPTDHARPNHLFVPGVAVYERMDITRAARAQLLCYLDVIVRQSEDQRLSSLNDEAIQVLLDWDAEKFRQFMNN